MVHLLEYSAGSLMSVTEQTLNRGVNVKCEWLSVSICPAIIDRRVPEVWDMRKLPMTLNKINGCIAVIFF